jgi:hypothetical protein
MAAVYLCSPAAKFVAGVVPPIDGGSRIGFWSGADQTENVWHIAVHMI